MVNRFVTLTRAKETKKRSNDVINWNKRSQLHLTVLYAYWQVSPHPLPTFSLIPNIFNSTVSLLTVSEFKVKCHFLQITDTDLLVHMGPVYTGTADGSCAAHAPAHTLKEKTLMHNIKALLHIERKRVYGVCAAWHQSGYWLSPYRWDWLQHTLSTGRTHATSNTADCTGIHMYCTHYITLKDTHIICSSPDFKAYQHTHVDFHCTFSFKKEKRSFLLDVEFGFELGFYCIYNQVYLTIIFMICECDLRIYLFELSFSVLLVSYASNHTKLLVSHLVTGHMIYKHCYCQQCNHLSFSTCMPSSADKHTPSGLCWSEFTYSLGGGVA